MLELFLERRDRSLTTRDSTIYLYNAFKYAGFTSVRKWKSLYYLYSAFIVLSVIVFYPTALTLSFFLLPQETSMSQLLTIWQSAFNVYVTPFKVLVLKWNMARLQEVEGITDIMDGRCHRKDEDQRIQSCVQFCNHVYVFYAMFYIFYPLLTLVSSMYQGQPMFSIYMFNIDWRNSTWEFGLQTCVEYVLVNYIVIFHSVTDSYATIYIYMLRTHMRILVERVRRLGTVEAKSKNTNYQELIECIKDHQNLLRFLDILRPVMSITLFLQFTVTSIIMCFTLVNILIFADTSDQIASAQYFIGVMIQITPCCYQATCLLNDNEQLSLAILQCNWTEQDKRFRKMLTFFMQRSQKPMSVMAMKLFPINLATSLSIVKFSFSLYTLIRTMDFGDNVKT